MHLLMLAAVAAALPGGGSNMWPVDCLTKVMKDAAPRAAATLSLDGARGETVSGQVAIRLEAAGAGARAAMTTLKTATGELPAGAVTLQWVRRIEVKRNTTGVPADELVATAPCAIPDPFWDRPTLDLAANTTEALWIEAAIPRDAAPGAYSGELSVTWEGGSARLPVSLRVRAFALPQERHQQVTNWFAFPGAGYTAERDTPAYWELARKFARAMVAHRQTCFRGDLSAITTSYTPEGGYKCDFGFFDRWAEAFFSQGMERLELFQAGAANASVDDPACRISVADLPVAAPPGVTLTAEAKMRGVLGELEKHMRERGWTRRVMLHVHDEPFLHAVESYRKVAALVHEAAPSIKVIEAIEATGFGDAIDVLVPKLNHLNLWQDHFHKEQAAGHELWFYTCCFPLGRYPNRFLDQPLIKARELHWICYLYGLQGYLHWGLNYFADGHDPYSEEGIPEGLPLGDRAIMYPGKEGPVGSLRWSAMRDGLQDYELLWTLECRVASLRARLGKEGAWIEPRRRPLEICRRVVTSYYDHTRKPADLLAARSIAADEVEALAAEPMLYVQTEPAEGTVIPAGTRLVNVRGVTEPSAEVVIDGEPRGKADAHGLFVVALFPKAPTVEIQVRTSKGTLTSRRVYQWVD